MDVGQPRARIPGAGLLARVPVPLRRDDRHRSARSSSCSSPPPTTRMAAQITPVRSFRYDTLVIAIGCVGNDFDTPGVKEHAIMLDTPEEAERFNRRLINACVRAYAQPEPIRPGQLRRGDHRRRRDRHRACRRAASTRAASSPTASTRSTPRRTSRSRSSRRRRASCRRCPSASRRRSPRPCASCNVDIRTGSA